MKEELTKAKGGREFLAIWEKVYVIGGIATAGPLVITGLFSAGARLWAKLSSGAARDFVAAVLTRIIMETRILKFEQSTFRIIPWEEVRTLIPGATAIRASVCKGMEELGIIMGVGRSAESGKDVYFILWKGDVVETGNFVTVRGRLTEIMNNGVNAAMKWLDNYIDTVGLVKYGDSKLSSFAINYRNGLGKMAARHNGNVSVYRYLDDNGKVQIRAFTTGKRVRNGISDTKHAEIIGKETLEAEGIPFSRVTHIFSELEPCELISGGCKRVLKKYFPNCKISYSYRYPGKDKDLRMVLIRRESVRLRAKDLKKLFPTD